MRTQAKSEVDVGSVRLLYLSEVHGQLLALLQTGPHTLRQGLDVGDLQALTVLRTIRVHLSKGERALEAAQEAR
jgi:hypothetical protein